MCVRIFRTAVRSSLDKISLLSYCIQSQERCLHAHRCFGEEIMSIQQISMWCFIKVQNVVFLSLDVTCSLYAIPNYSHHTIFVYVSVSKMYHFADDEFGERTVSILLDGEESEMIFIDHPSTEMSVRLIPSWYN